MLQTRNLAIFLAGLLLFSGAFGSGVIAAVDNGATIVQSPFTDLPDDHEAVQSFAFLRALGIFEGYGDGRVGPRHTLTRAEFAKIAVTLRDQQRLADALQAREPRFRDAAEIPGWSRGWINAAYDLGLVVGRPDGRFDPNAPVTYAEAVTMLLRGEGYGGFISPWPTGALEKADEVGLTRDLPRVMDTNPHAPLTRDRMAQITARAFEVPPPLASAQGAPDEDAETRREALVQTGTIDMVGADYVVLDEETLDLAEVVTLFGAHHLSEIVGVRVEIVLDSAGAAAYIATDPRYRVEDVFVEWTEDAHILLGDGRALVPIPDRELTIAINGGTRRGLTDPDIRDYAALKALLQEGDSLRLALDDRGRVEHVDAYRDTHVDGVLDGITPAFADDRGGSINLLDSEGNRYTYAVSEQTKVTLDGVLVNLQRVEALIYDIFNAPLIATVRAEDDCKEGGLDVQLHRLSIISDNTVSGRIDTIDSDDDGDYVIIGGLRYYYDPGHLTGGAREDFNVGDSVTFLLGSDDVARVILEGP